MKRLMFLLLVAVLIVWGVAGWLLLAPSGKVGLDTLQFSGTLEARQVAVVAEVTGQVARLGVREGGVVTSGAVLAELDPAMQDAQIARAKAAVLAAEASLAQVRAGSRVEQVDRAKAAFDREIAARDGAAKGVNNLQGIIDNPQELDAQIALARTQVEAADAAVIQATNQRRAAEITRDKFQGDSSLQGRAQFQAGEAGVRAGDAAIEAAMASRDGAQTALDLLQAMRAKPLALRSQLHAAEARLAQAEAQVLLAKADLDGLQAGPRREEVAIAQAQVDLAQASLEQLQVQREKMTLKAPLSGVVTALAVRAGENVQPGTKLMTLANLNDMHLSLYVPEGQLGRVRVGQAVRVTVDGQAGRTYDGRIYFISPREEFTPASVQTKDERAKMVFLVKVQLANADGTLKPGMPADAVVVE